VAQFGRSAYWITYRALLLRVSREFDDRSLVEAITMMIDALSFNPIGHGQRLDVPMGNLGSADFSPSGRYENMPGTGGPTAGCTPANTSA
jgi:hypothetical protein